MMVLITTERWPKHSTSSVNYFKRKTQSFIHLSKMTPEEEFSSLYSPLPPGFPDPLDPPSHLDFQLAIRGGMWIISGIHCNPLSICCYYYKIFIESFGSFFHKFSLRRLQTCILEKLNFKISQGSMPQDPPSVPVPLVLYPTCILATQTLNYCCRGCLLKKAL